MCNHIVDTNECNKSGNQCSIIIKNEKRIFNVNKSYY
jgi:hypothetical protein